MKTILYTGRQLPCASLFRENATRVTGISLKVLKSLSLRTTAKMSKKSGLVFSRTQWFGGGLVGGVGGWGWGDYGCFLKVGGVESGKSENIDC